MVNIGFPCWENKKYLEKILPSLRKFDDGLINKIIIVDQNSQDGSVEYVKSLQWDKIILVENSGNNGAWQGRNQVLDISWKEYTDYLVICDSDIEVRAEGWLKNMVKILDYNPGIGVVEGLVQVHDGSYGFAGTALCMCRMKMFREIGYFDPNFQLGGDRDFWCRIENYHWGTAFCPEMDVFHKCGGTTTEVLGSQRDKIINENWVKLTKKYHPEFINKTYEVLCRKRSEANKKMAQERSVRATITKGAVVQKG
jgi:GT2 family glycosyltransferase